MNYIFKLKLKNILNQAVNRSVTDIGCLTCALETPQQGLDMIEAAIHALGAQDSTKLSVALNIGASELFDQVIHF